MQKQPVPIPFPLSSFPGANPQEGAGRLINCCAEPLGEPTKPTGPTPQVWRRQPGLTLFKAMGQTGYRGGLLVNNLAYEAFLNNASTVDASGNVTSIGVFPGTKPISIARNQASPPDVIAVDIDNGAYRLSGGGAPALYTGGGVLPQPNSVAFQDGYLFFTIGDNRVFATTVNTLVINALTFITVQKKSDVSLLRAIAYNGLLWLFTSGNCEVWQDTAEPFPNFPYSFLNVVNYGLLQANAIAGFETGFDQLLWVSQDFGVYWAKDGSMQPNKVSPPDLDKLIETAHRAGQALRSYVYAFGGKKFWVLSAPGWSWEINLSTNRWNERWSLINGIYTQWRAEGSHPAFGKYLMGDASAGNLLWPDVTNYTENGNPQLMRIESGPITQFPLGERICRADFNADLGTGVAVGNFIMNIFGATAAPGTGFVRLLVDDTSRAHTNDVISVAGVTGTIEANTTASITLVDATHVDMVGIVFANAYLFGGVAIDKTSQPNDIAPVAAISCSIDGGFTWGNPVVRAFGQQGKSKRTRLTVKNFGLTPPLGARWRIDVTDAVYVGILGGTQSNSPLDPGGG